MPSSRFVRRQEQQLINQSDHERPGLATSLHTAIPFPFLILDIAKPHSNSNLLDIVDILTFTIPTHQHRVEGITGKGNLFAGGSSSSPLLHSFLLYPTRLIFPDSVSQHDRDRNRQQVLHRQIRKEQDAGYSYLQSVLVNWEDIVLPPLEPGVYRSHGFNITQPSANCKRKASTFASLPPVPSSRFK
jgi:hypothetical protein